MARRERGGYWAIANERATRPQLEKRARVAGYATDLSVCMRLATGTKAVQTTLATNQNHADTDWIGKLGLLRANGAQSEDLTEMAAALEDKKVISGQAGAHMTTMLGNATGPASDKPAIPQSDTTATADGKPSDSVSHQADPSEKPAQLEAPAEAETHHSAFAENVPGDAAVKDISERRAENAQLLLSNPKRKSRPSGRR